MIPSSAQKMPPGTWLPVPWGADCHGRRAARLATWVFVASLSACNSLLGEVEIDTPALEPQGSNDRTPNGGAAGGAVCEGGSVRCSGAALQLCSPGGRWLTTSICGSAALCSADPPACRAPACGVDELRCVGAVLEACNDDRDAWRALDTCASAAECSSNVRHCLPTPCTEGELACNDQVLSRCAGGDVGWVELDTCQSRELCEGARLGGSSRCSAPACDAGARRCVGGDMGACNAGRTDWALVEACATPELCSLGLAREAGRCSPPACAALEHRCDGATLTTCNAARTAFDAVEVCASAALCDPLSGSCGVAACRPGERRCNGPQIEVCTEAATGFAPDTDAACASAELCTDDPAGEVLCRDPVCEFGQFRCGEGARLQRCASGLDAWEDVEQCATAELCDEALGSEGCQPALCESGERRCEGSTLMACRDGRDGWDAIETCSSAEVCDATASSGCRQAACASGEQRCNGRDLEVCNTARTGFRQTERCASEALCVEFGDEARCEPAVCSDGEAVCESFRVLAVCNADLTGFDTTVCGVLGCDDEQSPARCRSLRDVFD